MDIDDFVKAIIADPHDDQARLVFADYLEERGDPRAEMIRLQFQLSAMSRFDRSRPRLRKRELQLLRQHGGFGKVPVGVRILDTHGGFIDSIEVTVARFLKHQNQIFANAPVRKVILKSKSAKFDKLRESPHLQRLASIRLKNNKASEAELVRFVSSPTLKNLRELDIRCADLSVSVAKEIANSSTLSDLRSLFLHYYSNEQGAEAFKWIAQSPHVTALQSLSIGGQGDPSMSLLADSSNFRSLKSLTLIGDIASDGVRRLQSGENCRELEQLTIESRVGYDRAEDLADRGQHAFDVDQPFGKLKHLEIGSAFGAGILLDIVKNYPDLETLNLSNNRIDDDAVQVLADCPMLAHLDKLVLTGNEITAVGMRALAESKHRNPRMVLYLRSNRLSYKEALKLKESYGQSFGNLPKHSWDYFGSRYS